jgi:hypothetical protein
MGLSDLAEEFRELDDRRRHDGLSPVDAERYHQMYARFSDALASGERHRRVDMRQFIRIRFNMDLVLRRNGEEVLARCEDFGGGGCDIHCDQRLHVGDDLWLDGALIEGMRHPLHGRAVVVWTRHPARNASAGYGLRFVIESPKMRDQVDRLLYRVLDAFFNGAHPLHHHGPAVSSEAGAHAH